MRFPAVLTVAVLLVFWRVAAGQVFVSEDRIKVFLFASTAFWSEVAVDAYKNACIDLDNNLYAFYIYSLRLY